MMNNARLENSNRTPQATITSSNHNNGHNSRTNNIHKAKASNKQLPAGTSEESILPSSKRRRNSQNSRKASKSPPKLPALSQQKAKTNQTQGASRIRSGNRNGADTTATRKSPRREGPKGTKAVTPNSILSLICHQRTDVLNASLTPQQVTPKPPQQRFKIPKKLATATVSSSDTPKSVVNTLGSNNKTLEKAATNQLSKRKTTANFKGKYEGEGVASVCTKKRKADDGAGHPATRTFIPSSDQFTAKKRPRAEQNRSPATFTNTPCNHALPKVNEGSNINQMPVPEVYERKEIGGEAMEYDNPVSEILKMVANCNVVPQSELQDVVAMEVDTVPMLKKQLIIIPDTNVWIDNQSLIQQALTMELHPGLAHVTVIIPWMVLQELDHNIHRKTKSTAFRTAAKFIHSLLSAKNPRVKGQRATEAIIGKEFTELMADDSILNCAMQYSHQAQFCTIFLTNDINLLNKALVNNITAYKPQEDLLEKVYQLVSTGDERDPLPSIWLPSLLSPKKDVLLPHVVEQSVESQNHCHTNDAEECVMDIDDPMEGGDYNSGSNLVPCTSDRAAPASAVPTFESVVTCLQKALSSIIIPKMMEEYGLDDWKFAIKIKPPFSVESALKCIQLHWIAVFSFFFSSQSSAKQVLDELLELFKKKYETNSSKKDMQAWRLEICQSAIALLSSTPDTANKPRISDCRQLLQNYVHGQEGHKN